MSDYHEQFREDVYALLDEFGWDVQYELNDMTTGPEPVVTTTVKTVRGAFIGLSRSYRAEEIQSSDRAFITLTSNLPREPKKGDTVVDRHGERWQVLGHDSKEVNGQKVRYRMQVRK